MMRRKFRWSAASSIFALAAVLGVIITTLIMFFAYYL